MRISRLTIDKLGIKLYDRVTAVLAELISNAYDADAQTVTVTLPWGVSLASQNGGIAEEIVVSDDGHGMTRSEVNNHYLAVGADRRRRTQSDKSRIKQRPVMGRKGIGKLAPFGICRTVEVITASGDETDQGWQVSHLVLNLDDMLLDTDDDYHPDVGELDGTFRASHGTEIKLRDFFRKRVPNREELDRQLSARFGLVRDDWCVSISNSLDPGEVFELGTLKIDTLEDSLIPVDGRPVRLDSGEFLPVRGFLAYSKKPYKDPAMAGVRIYARGKFVAQTRDFGIGAGFTGEFKLRSYLVGEIHADWLDDEEDLIRSDRQDILWTSERGEALTLWGQGLVKEVAKTAENSLRKEKVKDFKKKSGLSEKLEERIPDEPELKDAINEAAELLAQGMDEQALEDSDSVEQLTELAFSIGPHQGLLRALRDVAKTSATTVDAVMSLFNTARVAEMYSLGEVASERLLAVSKLEELIADGTTLESPLQELIEQAPWLLAPEWTPLGNNESLKRVRASFEAWYAKKFGTAIVTSAIGLERREPDFVLLHDSGILWIVEIKRMGYHLTDSEYNRAMGYLDALTKFLEENEELGRQFPIRRLTFVVDDVDGLNPTSRSSITSDQRVNRLSWHDLLDITKRAHRDFLERVESSGLNHH